MDAFISMYLILIYFGLESKCFGFIKKLKIFHSLKSQFKTFTNDPSNCSTSAWFYLYTVCTPQNINMKALIQFLYVKYE